MLFLVKQKTADEMRISDWSSDVCSSDLDEIRRHRVGAVAFPLRHRLEKLLDALRARRPGQHGVDRDAGARGQIGEAARYAALRRLRSDERRVGKECVSTCHSRWSRFPSKHNTQ